MKKEFIKTYGASIVGTSHLASNAECQDFCAHETLDAHGQKYVLAAIADGLGSCKHSAKGAKKAVEASIEFLKTKISKDNGILNPSKYKELLNNTFEYARVSVEELADDEGNIVASYYSTLVVAIYDGNRLYFGNSGDSGMIALFSNGSYELVTERKKGDEANSVIPLQLGEWQFSYVSDVVAFFMVTDGVLDVMAPEISSGILIYWPFFEFLITDVQSDNSQDELEQYIRNIADGDDLKKSVTDDITILVSINTRKKFSPPSFTYEQYKKRLDEHKEQERRKLYSDNSSTGNTSSLPSNNATTGVRSESTFSDFDRQNNYPDTRQGNKSRNHSRDSVNVDNSSYSSPKRNNGNTSPSNVNPHSQTYSRKSNYYPNNGANVYPCNFPHPNNPKSKTNPTKQPLFNLRQNATKTIPIYMDKRMRYLKVFGIGINLMIAFVMCRILFMILNKRTENSFLNWWESALNNMYTGSQKIIYVFISILLSIGIGLIVSTTFCKNFESISGNDQQKASYMTIWCIMLDIVFMLFVEVILAALLTAIQAITLILFFVLIIIFIFLIILMMFGL